MNSIVRLLLVFMLANCGGDSPSSNSTDFSDVWTHNDQVDRCVTTVGGGTIIGTITFDSTPILTADTFTIIQYLEQAETDTFETILGETCVPGIPPSPFSYGLNYYLLPLDASVLYFHSIQVRVFKKDSSGDYQPYYQNSRSSSPGRLNNAVRDIVLQSILLP